MEEIKGINIRLRLAKLPDAEFIISQRNNPKNNVNLSSQRFISLEDQRAWMMSEESDKSSLYFIIENKKQQVGTISLYNIAREGNSAELGRFICNNSIYAIDAEICLLEYAFNEMNLFEVYCRTKTNNKSVLSLHRNLFFSDSGEEIENDYSLLRQQMTRERFKNIDYCDIKSLIRNI